MPPTAQHMARKRQRGLTEPGGVTHFSLMSPLTLVVLQVSDRLSFQVRITRFGSCILITGGATGTERKFKKQTSVTEFSTCACIWEQQCTYTHNVLTSLYLVLLSGSSHVIWHTLPWVCLCTHSSLRRPFVCCGWWCLAPGLKKTGDQRPELYWSMFPGAGCPDLDQLPGRGWKHCLPREWECWTPLIFWKDCRGLPRKMQSHIKVS